jgi:polar amino acid transport system permease protein
MHPLTLEDMLILPQAALWTIGLSLASFVLGGAIGLGVMLLRLSRLWPLRWAAICYIRLFQGTPLLLQLFLIFFGSEGLGLQIDPWPAAVLGLSLNAGAFLGEIWRSAVQSVPIGQREAAAALGLRALPTYRFIILPAAITLATPPTVGFLVHLVKSTSLAALIGLVELTQAGRSLNDTTFRPFPIFGTVAVLYFVMCWPLSLLSQHLERRHATA